jgi:hypothetical protein
MPYIDTGIELASSPARSRNPVCSEDKDICITIAPTPRPDGALITSSTTIGRAWTSYTTMGRAFLVETVVSVPVPLQETEVGNGDDNADIGAVGSDFVNEKRLSAVRASLEGGSEINHGNKTRSSEVDCAYDGASAPNSMTKSTPTSTLSSPPLSQTHDSPTRAS